MPQATLSRLLRGSQLVAVVQRAKMKLSAPHSEIATLISVVATGRLMNKAKKRFIMTPVVCDFGGVLLSYLKGYQITDKSPVS